MSQGLMMKVNTQHQRGHIQSVNVPIENFSITTTKSNGNSASIEDCVNDSSSSVNVTSDSTTDTSVHGVEHLIRKSANNISICNSNRVQVGDNINCFGSVSFVNLNQTNIKITNQQNIIHDFGKLNSHFCFCSVLIILSSFYS